MQVKLNTEKGFSRSLLFASWCHQLSLIGLIRRSIWVLSSGQWRRRCRSPGGPARPHLRASILRGLTCAPSGSSHLFLPIFPLLSACQPSASARISLQKAISAYRSQASDSALEQPVSLLAHGDNKKQMTLSCLLLIFNCLHTMYPLGTCTPGWPLTVSCLRYTPTYEKCRNSNAWPTSSIKAPGN